MSGGDDAVLKVWSLKTVQVVTSFICEAVFYCVAFMFFEKIPKYLFLFLFQYGEPVARFKHHQGPITSVEWCPQESTTMMASGEDDQVTIWDIAVEAEPGENLQGVPPQLLFVHMGQKEIKEVSYSF